MTPEEIEKARRDKPILDLFVDAGMSEFWNVLSALVAKSKGWS